MSVVVFLKQKAKVQLVNCYLVYPASKSSMTLRHCSRHADLVSFFSFYISSNISVSSTSQFFPCSALKSPCILHFFLLSLHWGQSCRQCFIVSLCSPHSAFLQAGGCSFLDIKCLWVSLICPVRVLLNFTSYCLQLSHSSMYGLTQCSVLVLFSHSLCHSQFLVLLMVRLQSEWGSLVVVIPGISIACFALSASSFSFVFPGFGALLVCHIPDLVLGDFLCCSLVSNELTSMYILPITCPLSLIFFIAIISAV